MEKKIRILGFAGSLRKGSFNKAILEAAKEVVPGDAELETFDLEDIPLFNQDIEQEMPERVRSFKDRIKMADALLIATPEYNHSITGVLKNAMDWASRPYPDNSFDGKAVAVMSASPGLSGGDKAQYHLRQTFVSLNMHAVNRPEVAVGLVMDKLDENSRLKDGKTREKIAELLRSLVALAKKLQQ